MIYRCAICGNPSLNARVDDILYNGEEITYVEPCLCQLPRWISVEERLPEEDEYGNSITVLVHEDNEHVFQGYYYKPDKEWVSLFSRYKTKDVTHWMPLPEPPEGE